MKVFVKILLLMLSVFMLASCDNDEKKLQMLLRHWQDIGRIKAI
jgi:uncharacterized lipoprotein YajG